MEFLDLVKKNYAQCLNIKKNPHTEHMDINVSKEMFSFLPLLWEFTKILITQIAWQEFQTKVVCMKEMKNEKVAATTIANL